VRGGPTRRWSRWTGRDLNPRPPVCKTGDLPLIYQPLVNATFRPLFLTAARTLAVLANDRSPRPWNDSARGEAGQSKSTLPVWPCPLKLSAFTIVDAFPPGTDPARDRHGEVLRLASHADRFGWAGFWVAEHHFHPGGTCPSAPVLLGACGQRTERIRLGSMVSVLAFHDPIRLAEQYALLDRLVHGRVNLGLGSGYIPLEFEGFGIDPASKRERFDRALALFLSALKGEEIARGSAAPTGIRLNIRPVQQPHPPVWIAVQRREALPFVAQKGMSVALIPYATVAGLDELAEQIREFRRHVPAGGHAEVAVAVHIYAGPHVPEARASLQRYLDGRLATQSTFYQQKVQHDPRHAAAETIERSGLALIGSPSEVRKGLDAFRAIGVDEILGILDFGGLPFEYVQETVETLGVPRS
jgi:alkanesulfonate monooxygenase SsuD/methylene tetrahydromethanopterin reductase-like flavin-dependent oxidoreductase (luciferase family)